MQNLQKLQVIVAQDISMGYAPDKLECQDSSCIMDRVYNGCYFFGIFDGNGVCGKSASSAANYYFQTYIEQNQYQKIYKLMDDQQREDFIRGAFKNVEESLLQEGIDYSKSGTCVICVLIVKNMCCIANLGTSRAVLFRTTPNEELTIDLTNDHKPSRPEEQKRIVSSGGKIAQLFAKGQPVGPQRIWEDENGPGLAVTRALGNLQAQTIGLISEPEIKHLELTNMDQFIVIASDGLWNVMSSAEVIDFLKKQEINQQAAFELMGECKKRDFQQYENDIDKTSSQIADFTTIHSGRDDITIIIIYFTFVDAIEY